METPQERAEREYRIDAMRRRVALDEVKQFTVSTVRLTDDHSFGNGPSLWYETMIFDESDEEHPMSDLYCERYESINEAREGHQRIVAQVICGELPKDA